MATKEPEQVPAKRETVTIKGKWTEAEHIRRWLEHEGVTGTKVVSKHAVQVAPDQHQAALSAFARYRENWSNPKSVRPDPQRDGGLPWTRADEEQAGAISDYFEGTINDRGC